MIKQWKIITLTLYVIFAAYSSKMSGQTNQQRIIIPGVSTAQAKKLTKESQHIMKSKRIISPAQAIRAQAAINFLRNGKYHAKRADRMQRSLNKSKVAIDIA